MSLPASEVACRLAWSRIAGMTAPALVSLLSAFGSAGEAWKASDQALASTLPYRNGLVARCLEGRRRLDPWRLLEEAGRAGCQVVAWGDEAYPPLLAEIKSPPAAFYVRGQVEALRDPAVAVVGTRRASDYGRSAARLFATELARAGLCIVSGMARGIDETAHRAALAAQGRTIAVLGCGADVCYPPESTELKRAIEQEGAVVTQFAPGTPPLKGHFPARNRIIAGLSRAVLLAEAGDPSGALSTATCAVEEQRTVFAVPGSVFRPTSDGCHKLLSEGSASLACRPADMLDAIGWKAAGVPSPADPLSPGEPVAPQGDEARQLWELLRIDEDGEGPGLGGGLPLEEIVQRSGMPSSTVVRNLMCLELGGWVERRPGNAYRRAGREVACKR